MNRASVLALVLLTFSVLRGQILAPILYGPPPAAAGGTFTLRYSPPAQTNCGAGGTTCAVSLSGKAISSGDLLIYNCSTGLGIISAVTNAGTVVPVRAGVAGSGNIQQSFFAVMPAAAESGTDTITLTTSASVSYCVIYDYSFTGSPALDGANAYFSPAGSTTLAVPTFTPSAGSNNDVCVQGSFIYPNAATNIDNSYTILVGSATSWAHRDNFTAAVGPTWTWSGSNSNIATDQVCFGFSVTPFLNLGLNTLSGTNAGTPTAATLLASQVGYSGGLWILNGSGTFTYANGATMPMSGSTGRLNDGSSYSDASVTGIQLAGGTGSGNTNWAFGNTNGVLSLAKMSTAISVVTNSIPTDTSNIDTLDIYGTGNTDFANGMLFGSGVNRFISLECTSGQNHGQDYALDFAVTFSNGSAVITGTNSFVAGSAVQFITTSALPTNFAISTTYYVIATGLSGSQFEVSATLGGSAITAGSAGTGTQTVTPWIHEEIIYDPAALISVAYINGSAVITATNAHAVDDPVTLQTSGALPTNLATNTTYYVIAAGLSSGQFELSATKGGSAIVAGSAGSGTQTATAGVHSLKAYTAWASPSSPGTLLTTLTCAGLGVLPGVVFFGNANSAFTTGKYVLFDTLLISLDATDPL